MRVSVWQINAHNAGLRAFRMGNIDFQITRLFALTFFGAIDTQPALDFHWRVIPCLFVSQDCDTVERLLAVGEDMIAKLLQLLARKAFILAFDLLQAGNRGSRFGEPFFETRQAGLHPVDVECGDFHNGATAPTRRSRLI